MSISTCDLGGNVPLKQAPGKSRKQKFHHLTPAPADKVFPLKWYGRTGVGPSRP